MKMDSKPWAIIITTVALALFTLFWTTVDGQLKALDVRLRAVEQQIAAISNQLGIRQGDLSDPQRLSAGPPATSRVHNPSPNIP